MTQYVHFTLNEPLTLALSDVTGEIDGFQVQYPTTDGRVLSVSRNTAVKINLLDLKPGQSFCLVRKSAGPDEPVEWCAWLPKPEPVETPEPAVPAPDLESQLAASIEIVKARRKPPRSAHPDQSRFPGMHRGTGTYGRAPVPAVALARRVPYQDALREITETVLTVLAERKEQWDPAAKQDLISTLLIQAAKEGRVVFEFHRGRE